MANFFDQFDAASAPSAPQQGGNFFDQFDSASPQTGKKPFSLGSALTETWPAQLAKSIYGAATLPGDVYKGNAAVPQSENMGQETTANLGRVTDLAALGSPMTPRAAVRKPGLPPTQEELAAAGGKGYDQARNLGVEVAPESVQGMAQGLTAKLNADGIDGQLAPKTFGIISKLGNPPAESVATISNLESVRRALGHAGQDFTNPTEQLAARRAIAHLDDYLANLSSMDTISGDASQAAKILGEARGNYAAAKRSETISDAQRSAELGASAANSGRNIGNAERQKFKSILLSDKKSSGFNPPEIAQIENVVRGTVPGNTARFIGNLLGGGGGLGQLAGITAGAMAGGAPGAVAAPALGNMARALANRSTERQIGKLDEMVRSRSPLGEARAGETKQLMSDPQRAALVRLLMQTRSQH